MANIIVMPKHYGLCSDQRHIGSKLVKLMLMQKLLCYEKMFFHNFYDAKHDYLMLIDYDSSL